MFISVTHWIYFLQHLVSEMGQTASQTQIVDKNLITMYCKQTYTTIPALNHCVIIRSYLFAKMRAHHFRNLAELAHIFDLIASSGVTYYEGQKIIISERVVKNQSR